MAATVHRCCYCKDHIQPENSEWVGLLSGTPDCRHAPDAKHARQIVHQPSKETAAT